MNSWLRYWQQVLPANSCRGGNFVLVLMVINMANIKKEGGKWQPNHAPLHSRLLSLNYGFYSGFRCPRSKKEAQASLQKATLPCASFHTKISRCPCSHAQICLRPNTCLLLELHPPSSERSDLTGGSELRKISPSSCNVFKLKKKH